MAKKKTEYAYCHCCGEPLTEENALGENAAYCLDCQQKNFDELEQQNGTHLALWLNAMKYDLPLYPLLLTKDFCNKKNKWLEYIELLNKNEKLVNGEGQLLTFSDGETKLLRLFGKELSEKDLGRFISIEMSRIEKLEGTEKQREEWGTTDLWQGLYLTAAIYNQLDRLYNQRVAEYRGQNLSEQIKETLRRVCKLTVAQDYLQSIGDAGSFDKVQKSIDSILASEQLRKRDEKPIENFNFDSQVIALEKAGFVEDGAFLPFEKMCQQILKYTTRKGKYNYSIDVLDHFMEDNYNTVRANADLYISSDLPEELAPDDEYKEFLPKETKEEKENLKFAGLTKVQFTEKSGEKNA